MITGRFFKRGSILRWGKPCFNNEAINFHKRVLMKHSGIKPRLSVLQIGNEIVSLSYNICADAVMYNLQSGYLENFDKKVSLGTLHMGWEIENGFSNPNVKHFDFLAGYGKVEDYKRHYRGEQVDFITRQYFSNVMVFHVYGFFHNTRYFFKKIKSALNFGK